MNPARSCPECGLCPSPDQPDCATVRDALLARDFEQPVLYWQYHRLAIDTYCLQHGPYVESAKSLAAHLCGLCIAFEHDGDEATMRVLQKWLSTNPGLEKPALPTFRGRLTIADVHGISDPVEFGKAVNAWARSTWEAYGELHALARQWLTAARRPQAPESGRSPSPNRPKQRTPRL